MVGDHDVGGLDVAVNDRFLMGMLNRVADLDKQAQSVLSTTAL
jgi:hypothetical protein